MYSRRGGTAVTPSQPAAKTILLTQAFGKAAKPDISPTRTQSNCFGIEPETLGNRANKA
jgi:hypothetical protein